MSRAEPAPSDDPPSVGPPAQDPVDQDAVDGARSPRRRGRRPAGSDLRAAILVAARDEFAARGYDGATLRGIARAAGVDARLVHHYFDGKEDMFTAAFGLARRPADVIGQVIAQAATAGGLDAERLVRTFFEMWEPVEGRQTVTALIRSAATSDEGAAMLRQFMSRTVFARLAAALPGDDPDLRVALVASQMVGIVMVRYVLQLEPVASADVEDLVPLLVPTVQAYLTSGSGAQLA